MGIQIEYMSFKNRWTICSSCDFQVHLQRSQRCGLFQTGLLWFEVLPGLSLALPGLSPALLGAPRHAVGAPRLVAGASHGTPLPVIRDRSYSEGRSECPPAVWLSHEIDASKFTLHILSDTPGGSQWLKYILLINIPPSWKIKYLATECMSTFNC